MVWGPEGAGAPRRLLTEGGRAVEQAAQVVERLGSGQADFVDNSIAAAKPRPLDFPGPEGSAKGNGSEIPSRAPVPGSATGDSIKGGPRGYRGSAPRPGRRALKLRQGTEAGRSGRFLFPFHPALSVDRTFP